jgi:superoxide dismutase, Fe-Mn family
MPTTFVPKPLLYAYTALKGISERVLTWHHTKHYAGYVSKRNEIEAELEKVDKTKANANYSAFGELKRKETFNASGQILHEIYFENMGGDGKADDHLPIVKRLIHDFGSLDAWRLDLKMTAAASLGWAILCYDPSDGRLRNFLCDSHHQGAVWGAIPIVALDVFEHAYHADVGPDRPAYLENFFGNLHWGRINERFLKTVPGAK